MEILQNLKEKWKNIFLNSKADKRVKALTLLGLIGIVLIFLSSSFSFETSQAKPVDDKTDYLNKLENRVLNIVKCIEGVGEVNVMITLEGGVEYVFAQEQKQSADKTEDYDGNSTKKIQQRDNNEEKYIIVDGENGKREALIKTKLEPKVKGVVIVCEGADNAVVEQRVLSAITTALDISTSKVCVTKLN
jgi:stage III sporulation protein AG